MTKKDAKAFSDRAVAKESLVKGVEESDTVSVLIPTACDTLFINLKVAVRELTEEGYTIALGHYSEGDPTISVSMQLGERRREFKITPESDLYLYEKLLEKFK